MVLCGCDTVGIDRIVTIAKELHQSRRGAIAANRILAEPVVPSADVAVRG